jgi:surfeit locus 1 family protein
VNRGWVYSPDGGSIDRSQWREAPEASALGYVLWPTLASAAAATNAPVDSTRKVLRAEPGRIAASVGYPVAPFQVVLLGDSVAAGPTFPRRLSSPPLDEGPHRSYAIQWFSFAGVIVVGTAALLRGETRRRK